jgi:hypothetical protein
MGFEHGGSPEHMDEPWIRIHSAVTIEWSFALIIYEGLKETLDICIILFLPHGT